MADSESNDGQMGEDIGWKHLLQNRIRFNNSGDVIRFTLEYDAKKEISTCTEENWWQSIRDAIAHSPALEAITFGNINDLEHSDADEALAAVFGTERAHRNPLECVCVYNTFVSLSGMTAVLRFFKSTPAIKKVWLIDAELGDAEATLMSEALNHVRIEDLDLQSNEIGGEGVEKLLLAKNSMHLNCLNLEGNLIGSRGVRAISQFCQREDTEMRKFYFYINEQDQFLMLLESISRKSNLIELPNDGGYPDDILDKEDEESHAIMSQILKNLVCNTSSFESLCESNHQLAYVGTDTEAILNADPVLKKAFAINGAMGSSIAARCKRKLRAFYFQDNFNVQPFMNMDAVLMPFALELVTRTECICPMEGDYEILGCTPKGLEVVVGGRKFVMVMEGNLGSVYELVRNCHIPELFSFPSPDRTHCAYERRIASLEEEIARLAAENEELKQGQSYH